MHNMLQIFTKVDFRIDVNYISYSALKFVTLPLERL